MINYISDLTCPYCNDKLSTILDTIFIASGTRVKQFSCNSKNISFDEHIYFIMASYNDCYTVYESFTVNCFRIYNYYLPNYKHDILFISSTTELIYSNPGYFNISKISIDKLRKLIHYV